MTMNRADADWFSQNCSALFEYSPDAIYILDSSGDLLAANPAFYHILGYDPSTDRLTNVHEWDPQWRVEQLDALQDTPHKFPVTYHTHFRRRDTSLFTSEVRVAIFPQEDQVSWICSVRELNAPPAEKAGSMEDQMVGRLTEGVALIRPTDGVIVSVSPQFEDMFGYQTGELSGKNFRSLNAPDEKESQDIAKAIQKSLTTRGEWSGEIKNIRKDGNYFWSHVFVSAFDHSRYGRVWVKVNENITEKKRLEEEARRNETLFRDVLEHSLDVLYRRDLRKDRYDYISPIFSQLTGISVEDFGAMSLEQVLGFIHPDEREQIHQTLLTATLMAGKPYQLEYRFRRPGGYYLWFQDRFRVLADAQGIPISIVGRIREISTQKQAQEELRRSEIFLNAVIENSPFPMWISDQNGVLIRANQALRTQLHVTDDEIVGKYNLFKDNLIAEQGFLPQVQAVFTQGIQAHFTLEYDTSRLVDLPLTRYTQITLDTTISPIFNADGKVGHAIIQLVDITERVQTEQAVRESEARFLAMFDASPIGLTIASLADGKILKANPAFCVDVGLSRIQVVGRTMQELELWPDPDEQAHLIETLRSRGRIDSMEMHYRTHSGDIREAQISAVLLNLGGKGYVLSMGQDISQRKQLEREVREQTDFLNQIINTMGQGLTVSGADGRLQLVNPTYARLLGHSPDELIGRHPKEWTYAEDHVLLEQVWATRQLGETNTYETRLMHNDGTLIPVLITGVPRQQGGQVTGSIAVITDLSQLKRAELALRQSEEKYRSFVSQSAEAFTLTDERGVLIDWNQAAVNFTGISAAEAIGHYSLDVQARIWPPEMRTEEQLEKARQTFLHLLRDGVGPSIGKSFEIQIVKPDGERFYLRQTIFTIKTSLGYRIGTITYNITEEKLSEQRLRASEERLRGIFEASPDAIGLFDANANILAMNPAAAVTFGYKTSAEMIGKNALEFFLPEDQERALGVIQQILVSGLIRNVEFKLVKKDGTWFFSEFSCSGLYEADGSPKGIVAVTRDITLRKEAEAEITALTLRNQTFLHMAREGIHVLDDQGYVVEANPAFCSMLGYAREEAMRLNVADWDIQWSRDELLEKVRDLIANPATFETRHRRKDGTTLDVEITAIGVKLGGYDYLYAASRDITERKQMIEALHVAHAELEQRVLERTADLHAANVALEKASRAKDEFLAIMSHELRTPLSGILGFAQLLDANTYGSMNEKQAKAVANIEKSGQHLLELINAILDFSMLQSGKTELRISTCHLEDICNASLEMVRRKALGKDQHLEFHIIPEMLTLQADRDRLRQVVSNLLDNAVKFTPEGGSIRLEVRGVPETKRVHLSVIDTGIGIKEDELPYMFQPFTQLDARLSRTYEGIGLGLTLVKKLVELHGGSIEVVSVFGEGSRFTVILPWRK